MQGFAAGAATDDQGIKAEITQHLSNLAEDDGVAQGEIGGAGALGGDASVEGDGFDAEVVVGADLEIDDALGDDAAVGRAGLSRGSWSSVSWPASRRRLVIRSR